MTTYRMGVARRAPAQRREPPATGFQTWTWAAYGRQLHEAALIEQEHCYLDRREDECWRMFGITVEYFEDERVIMLEGWTEVTMVSWETQLK